MSWTRFTDERPEFSIPVLMAVRVKGSGTVPAFYAVGRLRPSGFFADWPYPVNPTHWMGIEPLEAQEDRGE